jgi:ABC-2 type transport system ATP-binding protein
MLESKFRLISLENISKSFSNKKVLEKLNLIIYSGEILLLIGKSGCGNSTFFKILIGLYSQDSGNIFFGRSLIQDGLDKKLKQEVGFVTQENSFYEKLTCFENLQFFADMYEIPFDIASFRIKNLLDLVNLWDEKHLVYDDLSGGMKRRLEFAISLVHKPNILILDEPFTGLDISSKNMLWKIIKDIRDTGVTIILASHQLKGIEKNVERVIVLNNKQIINDFYIKDHPSLDLEDYMGSL